MSDRREWRHRARVAAPPDLVWGLAVDTNRWDRLTGFAEATYRFEEVDTGQGPERRNVGATPIWGAETRFVMGGRWVEGRSIRAERRFLDGPWLVAGYTLDVAPSADGTATDVEMGVWLEFKFPLPPDVDARYEKKIPSVMRQFLELIERALADVAARPASGESPCAFLRGQLYARPLDPKLAGPASPNHEDDLAIAKARLQARLDDDELRTHLVKLVDERSDDELRYLRPFELARVWNLDERRVLRGFLHATESGLYELRWSAICPVCRVGAEEYRGLRDAHATARCLSCEGDFSVDMASNLEATFRVHAAVRPLKSELYCASNPWFLPHILAYTPVAARDATIVELPVLPGGYRFTIQHPKPEVVAWAGERTGTVRFAAADVVIEPLGNGRFRIQNDASKERAVLVERITETRMVRGIDLLTVPEFLDRFGSDAPGAGGEIGVGDATLLFGDLTGSTALYEELGDAKAFALIQTHFAEMQHIADEYGGAVVKTMGDGVMVAFASAPAGFRAAVAMARRTAALPLARKLALKVGIHAGPCLIVGANGRIDFFGGTVNIASRLSSLAAGGQIIMLRALLQVPQVARLVDEVGLAASAFPTQLRGLRGNYDCIALTV